MFEEFENFENFEKIENLKEFEDLSEHISDDTRTNASISST